VGHLGLPQERKKKKKKKKKKKTIQLAEGAQEPFLNFV
jgi:hypothetical protein